MIWLFNLLAAKQQGVGLVSEGSDGRLDLIDNMSIIGHGAEGAHIAAVILLDAQYHPHASPDQFH